MFDLTVLDYVYVGVLLLSTVWATFRGGVYETIATLSWVVAAIAARFASPWLDVLLQRWFELSESTVATLVASYFVVFFVVLMLVGFIKQKIRAKIQGSIMNVTDKTLGVIFGVIRGVVVMGLFYWGALWYYSDMPHLPDRIATARTRPIMQATAVQLDEWFFPGPENKLLARDKAGFRQAIEIYNNLINPAIQAAQQAVQSETAAGTDETGYKSSERTALENQLLQIETSARVEELLEAEIETE